MSRLFSNNRINIQISLIGILNELNSNSKARLINQYITQEYTDMPFCGEQFNHRFNIENHAISLCLRDCPDAYDELTKLLAAEANILMLCIDEFNEDDILKKIESINKNDCDIFLVKLSDNSSTNFSDAERNWITTQGWQSENLDLNNLDQVNQVFSKAIELKLQKSGCNNTLTEAICQKMIEALNERAQSNENSII